ncbi:transglutaminase family protein [Pelagibius litoralis]|uniref:Transglutaminase family protein n=1 Tax=Pelagibius litoralis TaxID=374515 RepID=A0A967KHB4_9PROT|nr:transglutaminase family protein [Pelagibius litoralis]NIA71101.1 transglutaminase family protein [Pelagibius litoralis]
MTLLSVTHTTVYRYQRPVTFGEHRLMFRPRDSHDIRLVNTALIIAPQADIRWMHDVFSNSIAIASFQEAASELRFESRVVIDHYGLDYPDFAIEPYAQTYPFSYPAEEIADLGRSVERHYPDPDRKVDAWAKRFVEGSGPVGTQDLLTRINSAIQAEFRYERRYAIGVQTPAETLEKGSGTCRDLAVFMMGVARALGFAARFVSGYLYDPAVEDDQAPESDVTNGVQGAGDTHAWVQIYLPGAGWVEFDPTNGQVGGANLIRVAVAREPSQAVPVQGTFYGATGDFIDMDVEVRVTKPITT